MPVIGICTAIPARRKRDHSDCQRVLGLPSGPRLFQGCTSHPRGAVYDCNGGNDRHGPRLVCWTSRGGSAPLLCGKTYIVFIVSLYSFVALTSARVASPSIGMNRIALYS